jgi:hypothetical protein
MSTPYIMICVEKPNEEDVNKNHKWQSWEQFKRAFPQPSDTKTFADNVWLMPLEEGFLFASRLLSLGQANIPRYNVFLFDGEPRECSPLKPGKRSKLD